jgi:predicted metal-dependent hydrolase
MMHLIERHHNDRFTELMDQHLPGWRARRDELNAAPLAAEEWAKSHK